MGIKKLGGCCCFDLKTGVVIIGILGIIVSVGNLIKAPLDYSSACSDGKTTENNENCADASSRLGGSIASSVIVLILMFLMIYGSQKDNHRFMLPILILKAISIVLSVIAIWYLIIIFFVVSVGMGFLVLVIGNAVIVLIVYFWLVIYSRSEEIKDAKFSSGGCA
ncbi:GSCOCG00013648001-RA-CDS [Cotesia congregata]|uniref:DUF7027 domain-containing protein n=1 Tax=Cotesia congregata TaxID=51543 RepID=A0A8J2E9P8_COTCN|nr:GSCOCG00013648001-RA-CDS [Cotesia congregata]CAG5074200.1 Protein of unknown function [Cotesia congregata]